MFLIGLVLSVIAILVLVFGGGGGLLLMAAGEAGVLTGAILALFSLVIVFFLGLLAYRFFTTA